ncbi:hypothetical protein CRM81_09675 [Yersinia kristensenii]|nr:hypothetical protein CRM81_09675 [Yersinia kristensenii]
MRLLIKLGDWRCDCTDGHSGRLRDYDPFGTFPRLSTLSAVWAVIQVYLIAILNSISRWL